MGEIPSELHSMSDSVNVDDIVRPADNNTNTDVAVEATDTEIADMDEFAEKLEVGGDQVNNI